MIYPPGKYDRERLQRPGHWVEPVLGRSRMIEVTAKRQITMDGGVPVLIESHYDSLQQLVYLADWIRFAVEHWPGGVAFDCYTDDTLIHVRQAVPLIGWLAEAPDGVSQAERRAILEGVFEDGMLPGLRLVPRMHLPAYSGDLLDRKSPNDLFAGFKYWWCDELRIVSGDAGWGSPDAAMRYTRADGMARFWKCRHTKCGRQNMTITDGRPMLCEGCGREHDEEDEL